MQAGIKRFIGIVAVAALVVTGLLPVLHGQSDAAQHAQQQQPQPQQPYQQQPQPQTDLSDKELHAFVRAWVELTEIREGLERSLRGVQEAGKARSLQGEARREMHKAVEEQGMTTEEYNTIAGELNRDPDLRVKALGLFREYQK